MAKRAALLLSAALVALIFLESRSLTSSSSSRLYTPSSSPQQTASLAPLQPARLVAERYAVSPPFEMPARNVATTGGWSAASLAAATIALTLCRLATPVATCANDGQDYDDSGLPGCTEWNDAWSHDLDDLRGHLEASFDDGEAQYYADSDMPSDVEFSGVFEQQNVLPRKEDASPLHAMLGHVEDLVHGAWHSLHSWKPSGFPFHHFPAGKGNVDLFASSKESTK